MATALEKFNEIKSSLKMANWNFKSFLRNTFVVLTLYFAFIEGFTFLIKKIIFPTYVPAFSEFDKFAPSLTVFASDSLKIFLLMIYFSPITIFSTYKERGKKNFYRIAGEHFCYVALSFSIIRIIMFLLINRAYLKGSTYLDDSIFDSKIINILIALEFLIISTFFYRSSLRFIKFKWKFGTFLLRGLLFILLHAYAWQSLSLAGRIVDTLIPTLEPSMAKESFQSSPYSKKLKQMSAENRAMEMQRLENISSRIEKFCRNKLYKSLSETYCKYNVPWL